MNTVCEKYYGGEGVYFDICKTKDRYCTYCCVAEFGMQYEKEKNACL